jgi:oxidase EvaA
MSGTALRARTEQGLAQRLARSAAETAAGHQMGTEDFAGWLAERAAANRFRVERIAFADMDGWSFQPGTGNLGHRSGRFFSVQGLTARLDEGPFPQWQQPIIRQPEVGILGILAKEFDGVLHFLMQAKMEPGNPNLLQLSPTVQATKSNYTKVHHGAGVRYLDYFVEQTHAQVHRDVLQSEHGSWFYHKANRNMLVETHDDVPVHEDFCWLTLGQIGRLLCRDNLVNMDSRTVLSCFPMGDSDAGALHSDAELQSWFTGERSRHDIDFTLEPLNEVEGWVRDEYEISRPNKRFFRVVAVSVEAGNREVTGWSQPLFEPYGEAVAAFLRTNIGGVPHLLVRSRVEAGFLDTVELGPTVQCAPMNWASLPEIDQPPFLDVVRSAHPEQVSYAAIHSEEGGRFLDAEGRYMVVDVDDAPLDPPPGFTWITPSQLNSLTAHGRYVNVQARSLLACINAGAV